MQKDKKRLKKKKESNCSGSEIGGDILGIVS